MNSTIFTKPTELVLSSIAYFTNQTNSNFNFLNNINSMTRCLEEDGSSGWCTVSYIIGWIYFASWSVSFYGQIYENYKNKHIRGLNLDYQILNLTGFLGYSIYNVWAYVDSNIGVNGVSIQDVLFALHAFAATIITISQCFYYRDAQDKNQQITQTAISITVCIWYGFFLIILIERILNLYDPYNHAGRSFAFNSVIYLGFMKAFISLIKYMPQVKKNYDRKSTEGWSIFNIIFDFTGGSFSLIQNLIDTIYKCGTVIKKDENFLLNIVKYCVSIIAMFFDIIFLIQHYILYRKKPEDVIIERLINDKNEIESPGDYNQFHNIKD